MKALPLETAPGQSLIGRRLRALREARRLTVAQLAEAAGVSKGFLSRLERDLTSPSVSTLVTLCQVLGASPGDVLDAPEVTVVRLADAPAVSLGGEGIRERLITPRGSRDLQILRADIAPRGRGEAELYTVDCRVEAVHVVTGRLELRTTEAVHLLEEGDTVTFPGREPHSWANPDDRPAVVLWTLVGHA
ncbi:helix-turn-helix domain-containing protein [Micrococcus sp. HSID17228]|uniref:XRE family transcriptional regulator n=1 Tax=unclassified Micrococcus TaxID=2620948 RepID=UPI000FAC818D|nr:MULTISPECIES: XRE family transcriptional regulator [unclassified Micrococcus]MCV7578702.1 XRE family transcriptional regulator [Micrococcus luteus]MCV7633376.1 XRE family transcriptional regulator [Micrococcus luteus]RUQ42483.1 helix-turn-helix domain-containing protein [Micrococcus sp. HSID17227]RUQ45112.1 helix-turn-helix domain-containing protein [Micrococcus sp. HSID17228]